VGIDGAQQLLSMPAALISRHDDELADSQTKFLAACVRGIVFHTVFRLMLAIYFLCPPPHSVTPPLVAIRLTFLGIISVISVCHRIRRGLKFCSTLAPLIKTKKCSTLVPLITSEHLADCPTKLLLLLLLPPPLPSFFFRSV